MAPIGIRMRWRRWLGPAICAVPYFGSVMVAELQSAVDRFGDVGASVFDDCIGLPHVVSSSIEFYGRWRRR